ncbi:hypothetical protein Ahy_A09g044478 [Arachis hypogaea]|uniref:Uncharacterized protein n=1 Tax=Arachis hypogaea TaxID=3818 RepID=A0A445BKD8_ARAHY|nr:hypothetical protein Ahy_A09g044478 [Arachis hypogaea]
MIKDWFLRVGDTGLFLLISMLNASLGVKNLLSNSIRSSSSDIAVWISISEPLAFNLFGNGRVFCEESLKAKKVGGAQKLSHQIDRLCEAVECRSSNKNDTLGPSITQAIEELDAIPDIDPLGQIYMFATRLFLDKDKRELFVALKHKEVKIAWLMNEKNLQFACLDAASYQQIVPRSIILGFAIHPSNFALLVKEAVVVGIPRIVLASQGLVVVLAPEVLGHLDLFPFALEFCLGYIIEDDTFLFTQVNSKPFENFDPLATYPKPTLDFSIFISSI